MARNELEEIWNGIELIEAVSRGRSYDEIVAKIKHGITDVSWKHWFDLLCGAQTTYRSMNLDDRHAVCGQLLNYIDTVRKSMRAKG